MTADETSAVKAKIEEWRTKANALDLAVEVLDVEDQHYETSRNRVTIDKLRATAAAYRVCAADAEGAILPF